MRELPILEVGPPHRCDGGGGPLTSVQIEAGLDDSPVVADASIGVDCPSGRECFGKSCDDATLAGLADSCCDCRPGVTGSRVRGGRWHVHPLWPAKASYY